jgi:hypothetical protein
MKAQWPSVRLMGGLFATTLHRLTPDILVDVKRDIIAFYCQGRIERVEPVLWIVGEGRQQRVIAVGARPVLTQPTNRIELFGANWSGRSDRERLEFFEAFWRYSLLKVIRRKLLVRPRVLFRGLETVSTSEKGDLRGMITRTLEMAGAHEVKWDEN